jgi:lipid-A-disaccharide synthase
MSTIMISCGEPSGDLYAGALASAIARREPTATIFGMGGARLAAAGADLVASYQGLSVTGLVEAAAVVPRSVAMLRRLVARARADRPDVFVPVDFPDFNFRLAAAIRRLDIPIVYYISPQLWAWRPGRLATLRRLADRVLVIFPFEEEIYRDAGIPVEFVGHPLVELTAAGESRETFLRTLGLEPARPTVALLPGSRVNEVREILPRLCESAALLTANVPGVQFTVARAPGLPDALFAESLARERSKPPLALVEGRTDDVLAACDVVVTASGTATVQAALHDRPMVIVYRLSPLTYRIGIRFVRVDTYGMVNLIAGTKAFPELIQDAFTPAAVAREAARFLTDATSIARAKQALALVRERLGAPGASARAASAVLAAARRSSRLPSETLR